MPLWIGDDDPPFSSGTNGDTASTSGISAETPLGNLSVRRDSDGDLVAYIEDTEPELNINDGYSMTDSETAYWLMTKYLDDHSVASLSATLAGQNSQEGRVGIPALVDELIRPLSDEIGERADTSSYDSLVTEYNEVAAGFPNRYRVLLGAYECQRDDRLDEYIDALSSYVEGSDYIDSDGNPTFLEEDDYGQGDDYALDPYSNLRTTGETKSIIFSRLVAEDPVPDDLLDRIDNHEWFIERVYDTGSNATALSANDFPPNTPNTVIEMSDDPAEWTVVTPGESRIITCHLCGYDLYEIEVDGERAWGAKNYDEPQRNIRRIDSIENSVFNLNLLDPHEDSFDECVCNSCLHSRSIREVVGVRDKKCVLIDTDGSVGVFSVGSGLVYDWDRGGRVNADPISELSQEAHDLVRTSFGALMTDDEEIVYLTPSDAPSLNGDEVTQNISENYIHVDSYDSHRGEYSGPVIVEQRDEFYFVVHFPTDNPEAATTAKHIIDPTAVPLTTNV